MNVDLAPLRWWHLDAVLPLERELFGPTAWSAEAFWSELAQPTRTYWVARVGAEVVGYAGLMVVGPDADVQTIAVSRAAQGHGVGRLLLDTLVDAARDAGAATVVLEVRGDNATAINLYSRNGFEQIAVRRRYYQPGDVDALVLRRRLR